MSKTPADGSLRAATDRGSGAKRAAALVALADVDLVAASEIALGWIADVDLEEEAGKVVKGVMVAQNKQRPAAVGVLARTPSKASLDALVRAIVLYPLGPTYWSARDTLVMWTLPGIAEALAAAIPTTNDPRAISCILATLRRRRELGDDALLYRLAIDPVAFPVRIENSVEDFQKNVLEVLIHGRSARAVDAACEVLRAEKSKQRNFACIPSNIETVFEMITGADRASFAKSLLAHSRFPRDLIEPSVLEAIERASAQPRHRRADR